jgi:hypothetical protein
VGIGNAEAEGLDTDAIMFSQARLVIDHLEKRQREFVGTAAHMREKYKGSKEFFASQH